MKDKAEQDKLNRYNWKGLLTCKKYEMCSKVLAQFLIANAKTQQSQNKQSKNKKMKKITVKV